MAALLLVAALSAADALFVEEVGKRDWIVQRVGAVRDAVFLPSYVDFRNTTVRGVAVCTDQNFVAVLNLRSGAIVWRKKLDDPVDRLALAGSQVITLSKGASSVKSGLFDDKGSLDSELVHTSLHSLERRAQLLEQELERSRAEAARQAVELRAGKG